MAQTACRFHPYLNWLLPRRELRFLVVDALPHATRDTIHAWFAEAVATWGEVCDVTLGPRLYSEADLEPGEVGVRVSVATNPNGLPWGQTVGPFALDGTNQWMTEVLNGNPETPWYTSERHRRTIILHEAGHLLGLHHIPEQDPTLPGAPATLQIMSRSLSSTVVVPQAYESALLERAYGPSQKKLAGWKAGAAAVPGLAAEITRLTAAVQAVPTYWRIGFTDDGKMRWTVPNMQSFNFGWRGCIPIVGDWNHDGKLGVGAVDPQGLWGKPPWTWHLNDSCPPAGDNRKPEPVIPLDQLDRPLLWGK